MDQGYIRLWRKSLDSGLIKNHNVWIFWTWCLLKANHKKDYKQIVGFQEVILQPGDFIFGRKKAADETGLSEQSIRTCLSFLKKSKNLTIKSTNKFSVISITNWSSYQYIEGETNQQGNQQVTTDQPSSNQQVTTNKNIKTNKHKNKEKKDIADSAESATPQNQDFYLTKSGKKLTGKRFESFNQFWEAFNYKKGKAAAADAWLRIPTLTTSLVEQIVSAAKIEASNRQELINEGHTPKWAQGWITERRWEDEVFQEQESTDDGLSQYEKELLENQRKKEFGLI